METPGTSPPILAVHILDFSRRFHCFVRQFRQYLIVVSIPIQHCVRCKYARLGRGPVFDDEIAAQADTHPTEARSKAAGNFREAPSQPAISGKHQGSRQSRGSTRAVSGKRRPEQSRVEFEKYRLMKMCIQAMWTKVKNEQLCGSWVPYTHLLVSLQRGTEYSTWYMKRRENRLGSMRPWMWYMDGKTEAKWGRNAV